MVVAERAARLNVDRFASWLLEQVVDTPWYEAYSGALIVASAVLTGVLVEHEEYYINHPSSIALQLDIAIGGLSPCPIMLL